MRSPLAEKERDRLIAAMLPDVAFDGWSMHTVRAAARRAGIPVATFAIGRAGAVNAALFAAAIIAQSDPAVASALAAFRQAQSEAVPEYPQKS